MSAQLFLPMAHNPACVWESLSATPPEGWYNVYLCALSQSRKETAVSSSLLDTRTIISRFFLLFINNFGLIIFIYYLVGTNGYCVIEFYGFPQLEKSAILILCATNFELEDAVNFGLVTVFFKKPSICLDLIEISVKDGVKKKKITRFICVLYVIMQNIY